MKDQIDILINQMTLEEKASLCSGENFWFIKGIERLDIPKIMVTDGPHGLRKQLGDSDHLGLNQSVKATCFPPAVTSASSWNKRLLHEMGEAIGEECVQEGVAIILGPGVNIKRSPLCGRNFEYFSEDPYLAGEMATSWVKGVQSKGIGTSLKHYAANNQEKARLVSNSVVDERALREIYLSAFEKTVKGAQPWTIMCSYNRINNEYACENEYLLNKILRDEWGYKGLVMTDWGAMNNRVKALEAGLDLEMPGPNNYNDQKIIEAVRMGQLSENVLDRAVKRLLTLNLNSKKVKQNTYDIDAHHKLAKEIAQDSIVLLKNEGILPLKKEKSYAVIGAFAEKPRYQGAGSSKINPYRIDTALASLKEQAFDFEYEQGYDLGTDEVNQELIDRAVQCSKEKDSVIIFVGLPDAYESEGFDRTHLDIPKSHNVLIEEVLKVNSHVVVVVSCGSVILMPWRDKVEGIVLSYLGGEAVGSACVDVLSGKINPSGRLAETFPLCLEDTPSYLHFAKESIDVEYRESIFVGYRYYDWAKKEVAYPFGYGLTYTEFTYDSLQIEWNDTAQTGTVRVKVTNSGEYVGQEVVQLYIGKEASGIMRAPKELKGFIKVHLMPGESKQVEIPLDKRSFAYYDVMEADWVIEKGVYQVYVGASSRDIRLVEELNVEGKNTEENIAYRQEEVIHDGVFNASRKQFKQLFSSEIPLKSVENCITLNSTVGDILKQERGKKVFEDIVEQYKKSYNTGDDVSIMMLAMLYDMPVRSLAMFGITSMEDIEAKVNQLNQK